MSTSIDCFFNARAFNAAWDSCTRRFSPDYHIYIRELLQEYTQHLEKDWKDVRVVSPDNSRSDGCTLADIIGDIPPVVSKLSVAINNAIESFLQGHWSTAIQHFGEGMTRIKEHLDNIRVVNLDVANSPTLQTHIVFPNISADYSHSWLYRARKLNEEEKKSRDPNMLFHVPFHKRERMFAGRFSLSGVPCLYISSSPVTAAWEVVHSKDVKDYEDVYYAKFDWNTDNIPKFVELQVTPMSLGKLCSNMACETGNGDAEIRKQYVQSYLACWPLQLACSIPVKHRNDNATFKEEYVIPQLLMHWLQQNQGDFHGVCYRTTRLHPAIEKETKSKYIINYALPTRSMQDEGHCGKLQSVFSKITIPEPISNLKGSVPLKELFEKLQAYSS